jgi:TRAP-type mannitol/chloroaromatic compound transport system substrate-binding protein
MATSWPKSLEIAFGTAAKICQLVSLMTNGRFAITPYAAGELVSGLEVLDAVSSGTVACGHTASYYYTDRNPALGFGTSVPFGLNAQQQNAWLYSGGGLEMMHELYADFGIINFPAGNTGAQMGGWFQRPIQSVADLQGLKMRIPGLGGQVMARLGVETQTLAGDEIFTALASGNIDAAEWVGPHEDERLGLHKIASYYYYPGWWEPGTTYELQVNRDRWEKLPQEYREILKAATTTANMDMLARYESANGQALHRLLMRNIQLKKYSPEILQAALREAFELYTETASRDATFKKVYERWQSYRQQVLQWHQINELSFSRFTFSKV